MIFIEYKDPHWFWHIIKLWLLNCILSSNNSFKQCCGILFLTTITISRNACYRVFYWDLSINEELEKMRMSTTASLLSGRRDILVVASVSCLYGIGNPVEFQKNLIPIEKGQIISQNYLHHLNRSLYSNRF
jgi:hypothetical protein